MVAVQQMQYVFLTSAKHITTLSTTYCEKIHVVQYAYQWIYLFIYIFLWEMSICCYCEFHTCPHLYNWVYDAWKGSYDIIRHWMQNPILQHSKVLLPPWCTSNLSNARRSSPVAFVETHIPFVGWKTCCRYMTSHLITYPRASSNMQAIKPIIVNHFVKPHS